MEKSNGAVLIGLAIIGSVSFSCGSGSDHDAGSGNARFIRYASLALPSAALCEVAVREARPVPRMVLRSASLTCEVQDYAVASSRMERILIASGGYVVSSYYGSGEGRAKAGTVTGRLPSRYFDRTLDSIAAVASVVLSRSVHGEDVTEEYYDVGARLDSKTKVEARYREILKSARSVKEILEVEGALAGVREEIDGLEGRRKFLSESAELSSITVEIKEPQSLVTVQKPGIWAKVREGFRDGVEEFAMMLGLTLTYLIASIPVVTVLLLLLLGVRWTVRRIRPSLRPVDTSNHS